MSPLSSLPLPPHTLTLDVQAPGRTATRPAIFLSRSPAWLLRACRAMASGSAAAPGMVLGVCGLNGCGKSTVCEYYVERGYQCISLSDAIRDALRAEGESTSRENMIAMGNRLRDESGAGVLGERTAAKLDLARCSYVIDSIRHPAEVAALRERVHSFRLIAVRVDAAVRYARLAARSRAGDVRTPEEVRRRRVVRHRAERRPVLTSAVCLARSLRPPTGWRRDTRTRTGSSSTPRWRWPTRASTTPQTWTRCARASTRSATRRPCRAATAPAPRRLLPRKDARAVTRRRHTTRTVRTGGWTQSGRSTRPALMSPQRDRKSVV